MMCKSDNINKENYFLAFATYFPICLLMLQLFLYKLFFNGEPNSSIHMAVLFLAGMPMLRCIFIWLKRSPIEFVAVYAFCIVILVLQYIIFPENRQYLYNYIIDFFLMCLPCLLNCRLIDDESHVDVFVRLSFVILIIGEAYFWLDTRNSTVVSEYSMAYSYYMIIPALSFAYLYYKRKKAFYLALFLLPFVPMVLIGSRGAVISCTLFLVIIVLTNIRSNLIKIGIIVTFTAYIAYYQEIITLINYYSLKLGITSRTLKLLENGIIVSYDSGRNQIWEKAINIIRDNWYTGSGIGADFRIMGIYSHNLFLDLLIHFGCVFGSIMIILIIVIMAIAAFKSKNKIVYLMLLCYGFIPALVSGTYLSSTALAVFMGYCLQTIGINLKITNKEAKRLDSKDTVFIQ